MIQNVRKYFGVVYLDLKKYFYKKEKRRLWLRSISCSCVNGVWWVGNMLRNKCHYVCLKNVVVLLSFYFSFLCANHVTTEAFIFASVQKKKSWLYLLLFFVRYSTHSKNQFSRTKEKKILNLYIDPLEDHKSHIQHELRTK